MIHVQLYGYFYQIAIQASVNLEFSKKGISSSIFNNFLLYLLHLLNVTVSFNLMYFFALDALV